MACALDWLADDCALGHWCPPLRAWREKAGWRARCPHSEGERSLSFWVDGNSVRWKCYDKACDRDAARPVIVAVLRMDCLTRAREAPMPPLSRPALVALFLDRDLPPLALRVQGLRTLGMSEKEIRTQLRMSARSYYNTVQFLAQNRRSA